MRSSRKRIRNNTIVIMLIVIMIVLKNYDMKFSLPSPMKHVNYAYDFYYKDNMMRQTRIFIIEQSISNHFNIRTFHESWFGFSGSISNRSLSLPDEENYDSILFNASSKEAHFIGMYRSTEPFYISAIDDNQHKSLKVERIELTASVGTTSPSPVQYISIFYITDVPSQFSIMIKNKSGDILHQHIVSH